MAISTDPFFADIADEEVRTFSQGYRLRLPVHYRDFSTFSVEYAVPIALAQTWLPSSALHPVEVAPATTVVSFRAYDHRDTDLAPYREMGVVVPVTSTSALHPEPLSGAYIVFLPVTTEEACVTGIEAAQYPKIVADITIEETPTICRAQVRLDGQDIFTIEIDPRVIATQVDTSETLAFNGRGTELTVSRLRGQATRGSSAQTDGARVTLGPHPLADPFREVAVDQLAVSCSYAPHAKMLLYGPHLHLPT
jgi:hypothetical protein